MEEHYKAINFDLDTNALKLYYPGKEYNKAYYDIRRFMEQNYDLLKAYARKREITARENKDAEYDILEEEELEL